MWNRVEDYRAALHKIQGIIPHCPTTELLIIVPPHANNPIPPNPTPGALSVAVQSVTVALAYVYTQVQVSA